MTINTPIIGTNTDSAQTFRLALGGLWVPSSAINPRTGITSVPVLTSTGNFTATVSPFTAVVHGTSNSLQGSYPVAVDVATTITITAANTQARIDLISLQIQDNAYDSSGFSRGQLIVTAGTPSGSPVAPTAPANSLSLWTVPVAANATSVVFSSATAVFPYTAAAGGIVPVRNAADKPAVAASAQYRHRLDVTATSGGTTPLESSTDGVTWTPVWDGATLGRLPALTSSTRPGSPVVGQAIYETDTGHIAVYNGAWFYVYDTSQAWQTVTVSIANTSNTWQYRQTKDHIEFRGSFTSTNAITSGTLLTSTLPGIGSNRTVTINGSAPLIVPQLNIYGSAAQIFPAATIAANTTLYFDNVCYQV